MDPHSLADLMATAAREMAGQVDPQQTYETAVSLAHREINGCDAAALTIVQRRKRLHSPAASHADASEADARQYELNEGPCVDATWEHRVVHAPDLATDPRWPSWGPRAAELGLRSLIAFRLFTNEHALGALNLYSRDRDGFTDEDLDHGVALAAHIAVAARSAQQIEGLEAGLASRTAVGTAVGIIMERFQLRQDVAFNMLARLCSTTNTKVTEVARRIVETGEIPT